MLTMSGTVSPIYWGPVGPDVPAADDMNAARSLVEKIWAAHGNFAPSDALVDTEMQGAGARRLLQTFSDQRVLRQLRAPIVDDFSQADKQWRSSTLRMLITKATAVIVQQKRERQMQNQDQTQPLTQQPRQPLWRRQHPRTFAQMVPPS